MEWDWVHLTSMDTVNPVKFSFFFFLSSLLSLPFKKNQKTTLLSLFHLLDKLLFINSFIYLFIYLNVRTHLTELLQYTSLSVTVAVLSGGLTPWFMCCVHTIISSIHASTHRRVNIPSTLLQTLGKELRATVLGGSCVWWCEKQRCMGSNGHGLVEILPVSLD